MTLFNPYSSTFDGEPVFGSAPVQIVAHGDITKAQMGMVQAQYSKFCTARHLSIAPSLTMQYTLSDGTTMRAVSFQGVNLVHVWPVADGGEESSGIGMKFIGWDDQPITQIAGYWLVFFRTGKWWAQTRENLVGANTLWVNAGRSGWLSTKYGGSGLVAYSRNRSVTSITSPPPDVRPVIFVAEKREHSASGISLLKMDGGVARLYQKSDDGEEFVEADSINVEPGGGSVLGIAGNHAIIATATDAYKVALSPELAIAGVSGFPILPVSSFSSSGDISYVGNKTFVPAAGPPGEITLPSDWSQAPDLGTRSWAHDYITGTDLSGELPAGLYSHTGTISYSLEKSSSLEPIPGSDPPTYWWVTTSHTESGIYGYWGYQDPVATATSAGTSLSSLTSTYTESLSTSESSSALVERGIRHDGSVWQISKTTSIEKSISGSTAFNLMSSSINKDCSWRSTEAWILPSISVSTSIAVNETFSEVVTVPFPEIYPVDGNTSVSASISKERLHFQYYDPDMDCAVFIKESVSAGGATTWVKDNADTANSEAQTPLGNYFYRMSTPISTVAGVVSLSVCVYLGAELAYTELLASGSATGGSTQYEPKAYPDMQFSFSSSTPKPTGTLWPDPVYTYGPGAPETNVNYEATLLYTAGRYDSTGDFAPDRPAGSAEHNGSINFTRGEAAPWIYRVVTSGPQEAPESWYDVETTDLEVRSEDEGGLALNYPAGSSHFSNHLVSPSAFMLPTLGISSQIVDLVHDIDRTDTLDGKNFQLYPFDASGALSTSVGTAKDAASGALAIEIHYTSPEFAEPSRSRILLVSPGKVTKLTDLIKVTDPENHGEFTTKFKTNNFLVTV